MKVTVKVSQLVTDDGKHHRGDILDLPEEQIVSLGTSVSMIVPTVEVLDEKDVKIAELEAKIVELERSIADSGTGKEDDKPAKTDVVPKVKPSTRGRSKR